MFHELAEEASDLLRVELGSENCPVSDKFPFGWDIGTFL